MHFSTLALVAPFVLLSGVSAIPITPIDYPYIMGQTDPLRSSNSNQQVGQWWNDRVRDSQNLWRTSTNSLEHAKEGIIKGVYDHGPYTGVAVMGPSYLRKIFNHKDIRTGKRIPMSKDTKTGYPLVRLPVPHTQGRGSGILAADADRLNA